MDVLTNKQYKDYDTLSRYSTTPYYYNTMDKKYQYGTRKSLSKDSPYSLYTCVQGDTYDKIALKTYRNPTYYWIICDFNDVVNCLISPEEGAVLKLPVLSKINF